MLENFVGFKACLHKTNWSSQPPGSMLPCQPHLSNSAWWATEAVLQPPFKPVLSLFHQVQFELSVSIFLFYCCLPGPPDPVIGVNTATLFPIASLMSQHASSSSQTISSQSLDRGDRDYSVPCPQDLPQQQSRPPLLLSNSSEREKSQKQRPYLTFRQPSLLERMNPSMKSLSVCSHPTSTSWMTSRSLLERISPGKQHLPVKFQELLN